MMTTPKNKSASTGFTALLLTIKEIAALDRCSEKTVRRAIKAGLLQALHVGPGGRLLRVTQQSHETYRKAQRL